MHRELFVVCTLLVATRAAGQVPSALSYRQVLELSARSAPLLVAARSEELVADADAQIQGIYANPTLITGTSTQAARLSLGASIPLSVLGQRGAALNAGRAQYAVTRIDTEVAASDVRAGAAHGFVRLWLAEGTSDARTQALAIATRIDRAVAARVEFGAVAQLEGARSQAQRLRSEADATEASQLVTAAAADLGRWISVVDASQIRTVGEPEIPSALPPLSTLIASIASSPHVRREAAQAGAARARAYRERALLRPNLTLDLGVDAYDPTLPTNNYRIQLGVEVPLFNQRGPYIEREERASSAAELRARNEVASRSADLVVAYRTFEADTARRAALERAVVPAAENASRATQESYSLGRASLEAVLDAERARIESKLALLDAEAAQANAWTEIEHALGVR